MFQIFLVWICGFQRFENVFWREPGANPCFFASLISGFDSSPKDGDIHNLCVVVIKVLLTRLLGGPLWHACRGAVVGLAWSPFASHGSSVAWYVLLNLISRCVPSFITCRHCPCLQDNAKSQVPILYKDNTYQKITCFFVPSTIKHFSQLLKIRIFSNSGILVSRTLFCSRTDNTQTRIMH